MPQAPRGFTIVEMIVVLAIIVIVTSIAITGQSTFSRSLLLTDTAYTIAFSVREAQTLGLSSRVFSSIQNAGYGIRFSVGAPTSYIEYSDILPVSPGTTQGGLCTGHTVSSGPDAHPGNCLYDSATEMVRTYSLNRGYYISRICGTAVGGTQKCSGEDFDTVDIVFMRPSTNAVILGLKNSSLINLTDLTVHLSSPDNAAERCIYISKVGQVGVDTCP
ncbi:MAG: prepilin-type N-terminal cleavage/methylation domain-containing protein [Patescibacteria group bacterium]